MADDKNEDDKPKLNGAKSSKLTASEERSEYFKKLEKWLCEAYAWQTVTTMFPYYVTSGQITTTTSESRVPETRTPLSRQAEEEGDEEGRERRVVEEAVGGPFQRAVAEGIEYRIPPIWKRLAAECIDSVLLLLLKFSITFMAIDIFDFIDVEDTDLLQTNLPIDFKMAVEITYELIVLEIIHRVIVCIFETFWLQHGMHGQIGGATPGKYMMGLRVVQCKTVTPVERPEEPDTVLVSPGTDLGLPLALGRSVVKNLIMALLFPICFALLFFRFNRAGHDLVCHSIVVEDPYRNNNNNGNNRPRQQQ